MKVVEEDEEEEEGYVQITSILSPFLIMEICWCVVDKRFL